MDESVVLVCELLGRRMQGHLHGIYPRPGSNLRSRPPAHGLTLWVLPPEPRSKGAIYPEPLILGLAWRSSPKGRSVGSTSPVTYFPGPFASLTRFLDVPPAGGPAGRAMSEAVRGARQADGPHGGVQPGGRGQAQEGQV